MDTVKDIGNFAYQNTGADNFMNIARGLNNGTLNYNPMNFSDPNSLWGNLGAGALDAGMMFTPGGGVLKAGKLAREAAGLGKIKGLGTSLKGMAKASPIANPKGYAKNVVGNIAQVGVKGALKTGAKRLPLFYGGEKGINYINSIVNPTPVAHQVEQSNGQITMPSQSPFANMLATIPTQVTTDPYLGMNGSPSSYLSPDQLTSYNSAGSLAGSQYNTGANRIQNDLLSTIQGIGRNVTGGIMDAQSQSADTGWAGSPQVDVLGDYINQLGSQHISDARLNSANQLSDLQMQRAQALNAAARAKADAEWQARYALQQQALGGN